MKLPFKKNAPFKVPHTTPHITQLITDELVEMMQHRSTTRPIVVVCIGTDRSTGDALGPLIGSSMTKHRSQHFSIYGTLEKPVHAMNLEETLQHINSEYHHPYIIGIDACLGQVSSVGCIQIGDGPVRPGAGVNKELPPVGDIHITGIVNVGGFMEYFVLQNTRLHLVVQLADVISSGLYRAITIVAQANLTASQSAASKLS